MFSSLALSAVLFAPAAPKPKDTIPNPTGPAPLIVYFEAMKAASTAVPAAPGAVRPDQPLYLTTYETRKVTYQTVVNGKAEKKEVDRQMPTSKALGGRNETFTTAEGSKLTSEEAVRRLKAGTISLISSDGKPVDAGWLRAVPKDTILIHSPEIKGRVYANSGRRLTTPAPRFVLLTPDADGAIKLAVSPASADGAPGNIAVAANGNVQIQIAVNGAILPAPGANPKDAEKPKEEKKSLDKINFEAYTANGESVSKDEALRRLKAGGIVLIAGSNAKPDEAYLKEFTPEVLVLVSAELAQSTGASGFSTGNVIINGGGNIQILPIQVQPLPAPVPAPVPVPAPAQPEKPAAAPLPAAKPRVIKGGALPLQTAPVDPSAN